MATLLSQATTIPLARPAIGDTERAAAERALTSGRLVLGSENEAFEADLGAATGRAHAIAVASGTAALELVFSALGIGPGDDVLVSAFGFVAAANAVARLGARPIPVDVDPATWTLDPAQVVAARTPRARAVVSIDQLGLVAEAKPLEEVAKHSGLVLVADAACGLGGRSHCGRPAGGCGRAAILSFHARKVITTGEGGAVVTDDADLAATVRCLRNHGQVEPGRFCAVGWNARLGEVAAAIGRAQIARLGALLAERRRLAAGYRERLARLHSSGRLSWQKVTFEAAHTYQTFAVLLAEHYDRRAVCAGLAAAAIESGPATYAFHRVASFAPDSQLPLPVADALHERALALPLYVGMQSGELDRVCDKLAELLP